MSRNIIATWTEEDLAKYVTTLIEKRYGRLLHRIFRATVVSVTVVDANQTLCVVIRPSATTNEGPYPCVTPGFTPTVGQEVECMWRDKSTAYVLLPANP